MNQDWYRRHIAPRSPTVAPTAEPTRFVIGPDGRAYPLANDGQYPAPPPGAEQYPAREAPWNRPPGPGEAPLGQIHASEAVRYWRGSFETNRAKSGHCPRCGSPNFFPVMIASGEFGGESGKESMGHCMACGYRNSSRGAPTLQAQTRGIITGGGGAIPIEAARVAPGGNTDSSGRVSGGLQVVARYGV